MSSNVEHLARAMYEDCPTVKPSWEQLGEVTRSVWREMVEAHVGTAQAVGQSHPAVAPPTASAQAALF